MGAVKFLAWLVVAMFAGAIGLVLAGLLWIAYLSQVSS